MGLRINCFEPLLKARALVEFPPFEDGNKISKETRLPLEDANFVATQCSVVAALMGGELVDPPTRPVVRKYTTYAYAVQDGPDCKKAVDFWIDGFYNFKGTPPPYDPTLEVYSTMQNTSFLALFNPNSAATIDCAFFLCPLKNLPSGQVDKTAYALSCLTTPDAYTIGMYPYTDEMWEQIKRGLTDRKGLVGVSGAPREVEQQNAGFTAVPSFFTVAAAALAVAFL